jgi:hypothetical protein
MRKVTAIAVNEPILVSFDIFTAMGFDYGIIYKFNKFLCELPSHLSFRLEYPQLVALNIQTLYK